MAREPLIADQANREEFSEGTASQNSDLIRLHVVDSTGITWAQGL
jgi:hypothetical protein